MNFSNVNAMKFGPHTSRTAFKYVEGQKFVDEVAERFKALRDKYGSGVDIGIDFHGAVQPPTALLLMKALEPYHPWFYEEIVQALNVDVMAEIAKKRIFRSLRMDVSLPSGVSKRFSRSELPSSCNPTSATLAALQN